MAQMLYNRMKTRVANFFIVAGLLIPISISIGVIYIVLHFVAKFW